MRVAFLLVGIGLMVAGCSRVLGLDDLSFDSDAASDACATSSCSEVDGSAGTGGRISDVGGVGGAISDAGDAGSVSGAGGIGGTLAYVKPLEPVAYAQFGLELAYDAGTLAVGAPTEGDGTSSGPGAVYVFVREGSTWRQEQRLPAPAGNAGDNFGMGLALVGDTLIVGAPHYNLDSDGVGAVYVYVRNNGTWTQQAELHAPVQEAYDAFGVELALSGDTLLVTASLAAGPNSTATHSGTIHAFTRSGTTWSYDSYFKAPAPGGSRLFGRHLVFDAGRLAIGAPGDGEFTGSAFVYEGSGVNWTYSKRMDGLDLGYYFGCQVALQGDTLAIGSIWDYSRDPSQNLSSGAAWVYTLNNGNWGSQAFLKASAPEAGAWFGSALHLSGDTLFVAAQLETVDNMYRAGAVHVFGRTNGVWQEREVFHAPNADAQDFFGVAFAGDASTLAIGATREAGDGSDPADNSVYQAGAVYILDY